MNAWFASRLLTNAHLRRWPAVHSLNDPSKGHLARSLARPALHLGICQQPAKVGYWHWVIAILFVIFIGQKPLLASERAQILVNQAQESLLRWDVNAAEEASQELLRLSPKDEAVLYLAGAVAFYRGQYPKAKKYFDSVKDLNRFEEGGEGFAAIAQDLLSEGVSFQEKKNSWVIVRFQNPQDEVMVEPIQQRLESVIQEVGKALDFIPKEAIVVEIYPSAKAFIAASPLTAAEVKTSGTIALCKYGRILLTTPRSLLRGYPWMDTLSHEYVHYVLTRKWGKNIPVWLHEGIAKHLEMRWRDPKGGFLSPATENLLAEAMRTNHFVTFDQMHPSFAKLPSAKVAQLAYAQVTTLIDFLGSNQGGWPVLSQALETISLGVDYQEAFAKAYHRNLDDLLEEWKHWLKAKGLKETKGLDPMTLQIVDHENEKEEGVDRLELARIESTSAREHLHLGDLLRYRGRIKGALEEYLRAREQVKGISPIVGTKLGRTFLLLQQNEQARGELEKVISYYPSEGLAYQILGDVYLSEKNYDLASRQYERALEINPFNPLIHQNLLKTYQKLGRKEDLKRSQHALTILQSS